jgi:hypothetical protein
MSLNISSETASTVLRAVPVHRVAEWLMKRFVKRPPLIDEAQAAVGVTAKSGVSVDA